MESLKRKRIALDVDRKLDLPPTTTSHLQPLDSGIIQSFKKHYRKKQLTHLVDCIDQNEPPVLLLNTAIRYVKTAWDCVTSETILNCWIHSGLVMRNVDVSQSQEVPDRELGQLLNTVQDDLDLDPDLRLTVKQFVEMDKHIQPSEVISENDIIKSITDSNDSGSDDDAQPETDPAPLPTHVEAKHAIETVITFLEHQQSTTECEIEKCVYIQNKINYLSQCSAKQKTIHDFFTSCKRS